jgi:hypothetical protein
MSNAAILEIYTTFVKHFVVADEWKIFTDEDKADFGSKAAYTAWALQNGTENFLDLHAENLGMTEEQEAWLAKAAKNL